MNWNDISKSFVLIDQRMRMSGNLSQETKDLFFQEFRSITDKINTKSNAQRVAVDMELMKEVAVLLKTWRIAAMRGKIYWTADDSAQDPIKDHALAHSLLECIVECETMGIKADFSSEYHPENRSLPVSLSY